ncbi:MAG: hypothetical protein OES47_04565, partial [Acidobacteriota bacterium]|nr:hypothetical protein [Acidobacteriota bacterium]
ADGRKVLIADSDHYGPEDISYEWVWKTFLRGQHPLFMDVTQTLDWWTGEPWDPAEKRWAKVHRALGAIQELVESVNKQRKGRPESGLADMAPQRAAGGGANERTRPSSSPWTLFSSNKPCKRKQSGACGKARANGDELLVYAGASEAVRICQLGTREEYRSRWKNSRRAGYAAPAAISTSNKSGCLELENPSDSTAILHLERVLDTAGSAAG